MVRYPFVKIPNDPFVAFYTKQKQVQRNSSAGEEGTQSKFLPDYISYTSNKENSG